MVNPAPIILFVYNRPQHLLNTIEALKNNELAGQSELFVYSDGPKNDNDERWVHEVRQIIFAIRGFKQVHIVEHKKNQGLANSIIAGVSDIIKRHHKAIVLEDDIVCTKFFLSYMNNALNYYETKKHVFSVSGFNYPDEMIKIPETYPYDVFLSYRSVSWGWGTWENRWSRVDWKVTDFNGFLKNKDSQKRFNRGGEDLSHMLRSQMEGKLDSWDIIWCYAHFKNSAFCIQPIKSLVSNIGLDGSGTHCRPSRKTVLPEDLDQSWNPTCFVDMKSVNLKIAENYRKIHSITFLDKVLLPLRYRFVDLSRYFLRLF